MTQTNQPQNVPAMISLEEARALVCGAMHLMPVERVGLLEALGRVAAEPLTSDIDISPFDHSAMDGFAVRSVDLAGASEELPVDMEVIGEEAAGSVFDGAPLAAGQCLRIMTGAPVPASADAVVKYEIVEVLEGDGKTGSRVRFTAPAAVGANIRAAGEEAQAGEVIVSPGEVISAAGVGFLAGCGVTDVPTYRRPSVAILPLGSELVEPDQMPGPGQIRNSNASALAACAKAAGARPHVMPIVEDTLEALQEALRHAVRDHDFVVTSGGAAGGDFDFIKPAVSSLGQLMMTSVNMRPGKAQTFGLIDGVPVFGLPGNPAAAFCGFQLIIRPALRVMQGYRCLTFPQLRARLTRDVKNRDPRRIYLRATLERGDDGVLEVTPAKNQSSGLFSVIQRSNVFAIAPEGADPLKAGDFVDCLLMDVPEEVVL